MAYFGQIIDGPGTDVHNTHTDAHAHIHTCTHTHTHTPWTKEISRNQTNAGKLLWLKEIIN